MNVESDALDREIIEALKRDSGASDVSFGARRRVALRLAGAGVAGFGVSAAGAAHALTGTSAAGGAASAPLSSGVASLTLASMTKTLVVGLGLGASVGLGLHVASEGTLAGAGPGDGARHGVSGAERRLTHVSRRSAVQAPSSVPPSMVTTDAAPAPDVPSSTPLQNAAPEPSAGAAALPARAGADEMERVSPRAPTVHARTSPHGEPAINPGPELPVTPPTSGPASLAAQQRLLERARAALGQGDAGAALAFIREHRGAFPSTAFEEERELLSIKALLALGRTNEASARGRAFHARFPQSVFSPSLEAALAVAGVPAAGTSAHTAAPTTSPKGETP